MSIVTNAAVLPLVYLVRDEEHEGVVWVETASWFT